MSGIDRSVSDMDCTSARGQITTDAPRPTFDDWPVAVANESSPDRDAPLSTFFGWSKFIRVESRPAR